MIEINLKYFSKKNTREIITPVYFRFFLKYIDRASEIIYKELNIEKRKRCKIYEGNPLTFFLRSSIKILKNLLLNFFIIHKFPISFNETQKYLYKSFILSEKFFRKSRKLLPFSETFISLNSTKISLPKEKGGNLRLKEKTKNICGKKNYLIKNEIETIRVFISNNLGKLTSFHDLNVNAHLELIEQVSDHSIDVKKSSEKIQLNIRTIKNRRKRFIFFENKIICFTLISFFLCYFL